MDAERAGGRARSGLFLVVMIAVIAVLIWAGVHNARQRRLDMQAMSAAQASKAAMSAAQNPADNGGMAPKLEGKVAPGFSLVDLDGKKVSLADLKGKPVLVNFWATWCAPCKLEMPWFEEFHKKYEGQGLVILGLAADDVGKKAIGESARKLGVTYPILLTDDKVTEAYGGIDYLPESFYVDRGGKVLIETAGMSDGQGGKDQIEANIKKLIAEGAVKGLVVGLMLAGGLAGQFDQPVRGRQYVSYVAESQTVAAGQKVELELRFHVKDGFHVNSHRPASELQTPTGLALERVDGVKVGEAVYSAGKAYKVGDETLDVYSDEFIVRVPVTAAAGDHAVDGELKYQACDRAACYPPKMLKVKVLFTAK